MGRWNTVGRTWCRVVAAGLMIAVLSFGAERAALAQNPATPEAWHAVVDTERLNIHSGRAEQFEKIATLVRGDVVLVKSVNTFGWAAIAPPRGLHGFVARQEVADGEKPGTVRAIGRVPVLYPISEDPAQCFRKSRVTENTILNVIAEVPTADNTVYLKVEMPEQVDVYVLAQFLRKATPAEVDAWKRKLEAAAKEAEAAKPAVPEPTPAKTSPKENDAPTPTVEEPKVEPAKTPTTEEAKAQPAQAEPATPEPARDEPAATEPELKREPEVIPATPIMPVVQSEPDSQPDGEAGADSADEAEAQPDEQIVATLPNLEQLYEELTKRPILEAEIEPLLSSYQGFAAATEKMGERRVAEIRIELLKIRLDQQKAMSKLKAAAQAAGQSPTARKVEIWRDEAGRPVFTAQGKLSSSNVFDGRRLPLLYRIQDELTGRTIAYLSVDPEERLEIERRLNLQVGVIGDTVHDPALRIDVVHVRKITELNADQ